VLTNQSTPFAIAPFQNKTKKGQRCIKVGNGPLNYHGYFSRLRGIEGNVYVQFSRPNKVYYGRYANGESDIKFTKKSYNPMALFFTLT